MMRHFKANAALVLLTALAYAPALTAGFIWDDPDYVLTNLCLRSWRGLGKIWFHPGSTPQYYPLTHTTLWINYQLGGLNPAGYHIVNVALQALAAILLYHLLRRLRVPGAFLAAAIFAVHPVQAESVAWITERKNVLCGVLYFAAALVYLGKSPQGAGPGIARLLAALLLFACALFAKTVAVSLPPALLLVLWWKRGRPLTPSPGTPGEGWGGGRVVEPAAPTSILPLSTRGGGKFLRWPDVLRLVPFFILGAILAVNTAWMERQTVGAVGAEFNFSLLDRFQIAARAPWFYAGKLVCPYRLAFIYPRWDLHSHVWLGYLLALATVALVATLWRWRRTFGRGPLVAVLIFGGTLLPALGLVNVFPMRYSFVADHFQYLAVAPIAGLVGAVVFHWPNRRAQTAATALILALLAILTFIRCDVYQDAVQLWQDTVAKNPDSWMVHLNLGKALDSEHRGAGLADLRQACHLADIPETRLVLGHYLASDGRFDDARTDLDVLRRDHPDFAPAYYEIGRIFELRHDPDQAAQWYHRALQFQDLPQAHFALAMLAGQQNDPAEEARQLIATLAIAPDSDSIPAHLQLAALYLSDHNPQLAAQQFQAVLAFDPDNAEAKAGLGVESAQ